MKKSILFIIVVALLVFIPLNVDAALCTRSSYGKLQNESTNVKVSYMLKFDEHNQHYFEITVANLTSGLVMKYNDAVYEYDKNKPSFTLASQLQGGGVYEFDLYGSNDSNCPDEYVATKKLTLPKYNIYSEKKECIEYENWKLCNKWYDGEIKNDEDFYKKLEEYKKSLKEEVKPVSEKEEEKSFLSKIIDFYVENIIITGPITGVVFIGIAILVINRIRKNKKRTKVHYEEL